jgi:hypothetical protein
MTSREGFMAQEKHRTVLTTNLVLDLGTNLSNSLTIHFLPCNLEAAMGHQYRIVVNIN